MTLKSACGLWPLVVVKATESPCAGLKSLFGALRRRATRTVGHTGRGPHETPPPLLCYSRALHEAATGRPPQTAALGVGQSMAKLREKGSLCRTATAVPPCAGAVESRTSAINVMGEPWE